MRQIDWGDTDQHEHIYALCYESEYPRGKEWEELTEPARARYRAKWDGPTLRQRFWDDRDALLVELLHKQPSVGRKTL